MSVEPVGTDGLTDAEREVIALRASNVAWIEITYRIEQMRHMGLTSWAIRQMHEHAVTVLANLKG